MIWLDACYLPRYEGGSFFHREGDMASTASVASGLVQMLKEDHNKVKELFEEFESAKGRERGGNRSNGDSGVGSSCGFGRNADLSRYPQSTRRR